MLADAVDQFIYQRITAKTAVTALVGSRIYREIAPQDATLPLIIFARIDQEDLAAIGQPVTSAVYTYDVQIHAEGESATPLVVAADAIAEALDGEAASIGSVYVAARKVRDTKVPTYVVDGLIHQRIGSEYELFAAKP